jgi:hypothetical protein
MLHLRQVYSEDFFGTGWEQNLKFIDISTCSFQDDLPLVGKLLSQLSEEGEPRAPGRRADTEVLAIARVAPNPA